MKSLAENRASPSFHDLAPVFSSDCFAPSSRRSASWPALLASFPSSRFGPACLPLPARDHQIQRHLYPLPPHAGCLQNVPKDQNPHSDNRHRAERGGEENFRQETPSSLKIATSNPGITTFRDSKAQLPERKKNKEKRKKKRKPRPSTTTLCVALQSDLLLVPGTYPPVSGLLNPAPSTWHITCNRKGTEYLPTHTLTYISFEEPPSDRR